MKKHEVFIFAVLTFSLLTLLMIQPGWTAVKAEAQDAAIKTKVVQTYMKIPLHFIRNEGQVDDKVKFYEKGSGHSTFFTEEGIYITLHDKKKVSSIKLSLLNANKKPEIIGEDRLEGKVNYFIGNNKKKWKTDISTYTSVRYKDIYEDIDIKFYGNNKQLEYDIVVKPGSDPSVVKFLYEGIRGLKVTDEGDLEVDIKEKKIIHKKPYIYQEIEGQREEIEGAFKVFDKNTYGFQVASYNKNHSLIIDPVLIYSTYLGGSNSDKGLDIAVDSSGNVYISGVTDSTDFPTQSPFQVNNAGGNDVFVTKINASGNALIYSTYLGGMGDDGGEGNLQYEYACTGLAVDDLGNAYVTGLTRSTDFPTQDPLQANNAGQNDVFVTKINAAGNALVYSTYLGGSHQDNGVGIALDSSDNVYITGSTSSEDFPTQNPIQPNHAGSDDAFVAKINSSGSALVYSTYLGGRSQDNGSDIALDSSDNAYIIGRTSSSDFPTFNPIQPSGDGYGAGDVFVTKINSAGDVLVYSTYLGGGYLDGGNSIAVDNSGNAYITGRTWSVDFPTQNPIQPSISNITDAFVAKINAAGDALMFSTFLGGNGSDGGTSIAIDVTGNSYIAGYTISTDFPTQNPLQLNNAGHQDVFVTKINASGSALIFSTYLGGNDDETGIGIALDSSGNVYVSGYTYSTNFPTYNPLQPNHAGDHDAFITKIGGFAEDPPPNPIVDPAPEIKANSSDGPVTLTTSGTLSISVSFTAGSSAGVNADWWVAADTPFGWHYYIYPNSWYYAPDPSYLQPAYQGALFNLGTFEILNITGLPAGTYTIYCGVDTIMNGQIDFDHGYHDSAVVTITP